MKTIAFFSLIGPAAAAVPYLVTILILAAFHRDATGLGIAGAALFLAYVYGLIPSVVSGLLFSLAVARRPHVVNRIASVARVGAVAGFLSSLPLAAWAFLITEKGRAYDHALIALAFLVPGIFSGAVCAVLWRRCEGGGDHNGKATAPANRSATVLLGFPAMLISSLPGALSSADAADNAPVPASWSDDFSDPAAFAVNWRPYGFLATGIDARHPLGKTVSGDEARPEWWQLVDGALRGQCFPDEKHPPGLRRAISGTDIRLHCRFKIAAEGQIGISVGGPNPIVEKDFNVAGLHIRPEGITAWDNDVLHPKVSPEAKELKAKGTWNRKFFYAKTEKLSIAPDVWHSLVLELRGKELTVMLNGKLALTYTTLCGDVPKNDIGLQPGGKSRKPLASWFDDIRVEPLPAGQ